MKTLSLIIDCDPGVDDAVALMLAFGSSELELLAVTTVGGNVPLAKTTRNARMLRQIAGREDVPVHAGADRPLRRKPAGAGEFHGEEGLGFMTPFTPAKGVADGHGVDALINAVMAREPETVALAVLGPMTNLALALRREPTLARRLGPVAIMGGARSEGGNITASAEFNVWADPEAADEVMRSGCRITMFGLDATHQVRATEERIAAVAGIGTPKGDTAAAMMRFSQKVEREIVGWDAPPVHDVCPVAWLLKPELFELKPCRIAVEFQSELTRGHTAVEFRVDPAEAPHRWAVSADADGVFALITEAVR
ncbi:nucleoside hydrolase [Brevundimonas sp. Root1423]|uniref:nucleoside hydrolase n=1 Tax=Brevundimonas sp. Root1423 TaxID=1736462 RepID=UPI0009E92113|nr:nucleoside hydrolase [Brevundimonas sp. Root1423]